MDKFSQHFSRTNNSVSISQILKLSNTNTYKVYQTKHECDFVNTVNSNSMSIELIFHKFLLYLEVHIKLNKMGTPKI